MNLKGGPVMYPVGWDITLFDRNLNRQCSSNAMVLGTYELYNGLLKPHVKSSDPRPGREFETFWRNWALRKGIANYDT